MYVVCVYVLIEFANSPATWVSESLVPVDVSGGAGDDESANVAPESGGRDSPPPPRRDGPRDGRRDDRAREPRDLPTSPPYSMFVGNLSFDVTEDDLRDFFSKDGVRTRIVLVLSLLLFVVVDFFFSPKSNLMVFV